MIIISYQYIVQSVYYEWDIKHKKWIGLTFLAVIMALFEYNMMVANVVHCKCRRVEENTCDCDVESVGGTNAKA